MQRQSDELLPAKIFRILCKYGPLIKTCNHGLRLEYNANPPSYQDCKVLMSALSKGLFSTRHHLTSVIYRSFGFFRNP
jgi:hypothetical protein